MAETPYFSPELPAKFLGGPARPVTLLPDIEPPSSARPPGGFDDDPGAGSIGGTIDPTAREQLGGFKDEWAGFADAPAQDFSQFADGPNEFDAFASADELDARTVEDLDKDRENFRPAEYFSSNPDVARDPKKLSKLLEVYRRRDEEGLTAKGVAKAAIENTPGLVGDIAGGIKRLGERAIDLTVQPVVNVLGSVLTGDIFDDKKREAFFAEAKKSVKKSASEVGAGSEAATVGLVDLARTGIEKLPKSQVAFPGRFTPPTGAPLPEKKKTDQQLLAQLSDDASFRQVADAAMRGEGEAAKIAGLDKETLAKQGIEIDEKSISQLSLVDPVTMLATGGAFKLVGVGGKILGTARTIEGAQQLADKLASVAKFAAGKSVQGLGKATTFVGETFKGSGSTASLVGGMASVAGGGSVPTSVLISGGIKVAGQTARKVGPLLEHGGKAIAGEVPVSASLQKVLDYAGTAAAPARVVGKGAVEGLVAGSPFALAAQDDETAGALLGAGAALGAAGGAGAGAFRVVKQGASRRYFGENRPVLEDVASPAYGKEPALDSIHEANIQKLSAQDASELNNFREILRQQGGEIYALDRPSWRKEMERIFPDITPEQLDVYENHSAFFDEPKGPDRRVVYLNVDTKGLQHDAGHIFDAILSPEKRTELRKAVTDTFGQKSIDDLKATYQRRVGNKISDKAAVDEFIAEQFAALFNNVPVTELAAPKSLLNKFIDTVAEGAESLGIDLSAGAGTPQFGAPVSVGIRQLFRNAAGDVMRANIEGTPPTNITPFPGSPEPTPGPAPTAPPTNVTPLPGIPSRNIRVGPENVASFKQSASPDVRAAADARARETGVDYARTEAKKNDGSATSRVIESISDSMESGRPVVQIEHLGITSASTPEAPLGRTPRRGEQAAGYAALEAAQLDVRQNAPPEIVSQHSKNFVPVRWTDQGGTPTLIAMSLDKVIANMMKVAADPKAKDLIPYPVENGKFTPEGWRQVVADAQAYSENQANGRRGDGGRLDVPEAGLSIPAENPAYTPQPLSPERANFQNLVQGLAPPQTARAQKGVTPGNVKGQILAEANLRPTETPANIAPRRVGKQAFVDFPPRTVQEVNPLRNRLKEAGAPSVGELIEVTERIRAIDIEKVTPRPDISFKAPVTDIIRGGFLPATEFRQKNLQGRTVEEFAKTILDATPEEWKAATDAFTGGLTGGAWSLGLGLKNAADVGVLKSFQEKLSTATKEAMQSGDFDKAYSLVSKGQFFREAYEASTGTGSAGAAFKRGTMGTEGVKVPFPVVEKTQATAAATPDSTTITIGESGAQFLPRTESGKALEKQGFKIRPFGELGVRGVEIFDRDNNRAGEIISEELRPNEVSVNNVLVRPNFRGKGVGEALYRELAAQLKEDGVKRVVGDVVAPEPLALRSKVFGDFETLDVNGQPASIEDALTAANMTRKGVQFSHVEAANRITPESQFLPAEQLDLGSVSEEPRLRVLPAAPGGRPPIEPPGLRPPPVASGFLPAEELQPEEAAPDVRVLPAAPGGRPPTEPPVLRPPPVAAGVAEREENKAGFLPTPDEDIRKLAKSYADGAGLPYAPKGGYAEVKPDLAKRLADFYEGAKSDPNDPAVKSSYDALIRETEEQGKSILAAGYKIEPWTGEGEPYKNSAAAIADVRDNKHLFFRQTEGAFGSGNEAAGNPMLAESRIVPGQSVNDVFRWVHDFFGHSKEGFQFGPRGEFNAWRSHAEMFSPEAQGALAAETLAQNSWVNYGPQAKDLPPSQRPFAPQKNVLVPRELIAEAAQPQFQASSKTADISGFLPKVKRDAQGRPLKKSGEIDYKKWQIEGVTARKKREAEPIESVEPRGRISLTGAFPTGWVLPDKTFVPLDTAYHEQFLAENAKDLNKRFGTALSETPSVGDRLDALNAGFVRFRYDNRSGNLLIEANAGRWPRIKPTVKRRLQDYEDRITGFTLSLLNDRALQVDSVTVPRMQELSGPQKLNAIDEAVDSLRVPTQ